MSLLWHLDGISGCFFFVYDEGMEEYVARLIRAGVSACEAFYIVRDFAKHYSADELEEYTRSIEAAAYVAAV